MTMTRKIWRLGIAGSAVLAMLAAASAQGQNGTPAPLALSLKRAVELALQNSRDLQVARIQASIAERAAFITRAEFLPNLFAGSGAAYTHGIPETPGGRAPAIFDVTYTEQVFNRPLWGQARELQEQASGQKLILEDVRNGVIQRTASAYLELSKVRHSLELLRKQQESAEKILQVTQERQNEGFELPVEVTKAQLTRARVKQRILQFEGREDEIEVFLRGQLGLAQNQIIEVAPEDLPGAAEQAGADLVALAQTQNVSIRLAESDARAREFRLKGEKGGHLPTIEAVGVYSLLGKFNNYAQFFNHFQRNNVNLGVQIQVPIFSARIKGNIDIARINLDVARASLSNKKMEVSAEVRQKTRRIREMEAAREVARLELQLAQQRVGVLQSQFSEGQVNLREVEQARLEENDKWMAYLDATFQRQQAQLDLLRAAGQLDKVFQ
jgi:outer membrane protein